MLQIPPPKIETSDYVNPKVVWEGGASTVLEASLSEGGPGLYNVYISNSNQFYDYHAAVVITQNEGEPSRGYFVGPNAGNGIELDYYNERFRVPNTDNSGGNTLITKIVKIK